MRGDDLNHDSQLSNSPGPARWSGTGLFVGFVLIGAAVSVAIGVYSRSHVPTGRPITTLGFSTLLDMKVWLATAAVVFAFVQVGTALRIYGRIGAGPSTPTAALTHRISGVVAVALTLPVAFHCLWSLGFGTYSTRVLVHSVVGCAFYGVFVTKMLAVRSSRLPAWALPVLGGVLFTILVTIWLTSSLWFFNSGRPSY